MSPFRYELKKTDAEDAKRTRVRCAQGSIAERFDLRIHVCGISLTCDFDTWPHAELLDELLHPPRRAPPR